MPRAGDESDTETFEIVEWVAERMDLELATVAGTRVNGANAQCTTQHSENALLQPCCDTQGFVGRWRQLGGNSRAMNLT